MPEEADGRRFRYTVPLALIIAATLSLAAAIVAANAHDHARPDLDDWYSSLQHPIVGSCCSKQDCHPTQAEWRAGERWARLGRRVPRLDGPGFDWELLDWVKVPPRTLLPVPNAAGEPVICHSDFEPGQPVGGVAVFCFVPEVEG